MTDKQLEALWKKAKNGRSDTKSRIAEDTSTPVEIINYLMNDTDSRVAMRAANNPNIDESSFDTIIKIAGVVSSVYKSFYENESFKREWCLDWIKLMYQVDIDTQYIFRDTRMFDSVDEWIQIVEWYHQFGQTSIMKAKTDDRSWFSFFEYPPISMREFVQDFKLIEYVLNNHGEHIWKNSPGTFNTLFNFNNEHVKILLYKITQKPEYLPDDLAQLFLI